MTPDQTVDHEPGRAESLRAYIAGARWFGGKGRDFEVTAVTSFELAPDVSTNLVRVRFADPDGGAEQESDLYQLPLVTYDEPQDRLGHALVGTWDGRLHYDAVHDRAAMQVWLRAFAGEPDATGGPVEFRRTDDHQLDLETHSTLYSGEQSNSSLAFGEDSMLKIFRRITPGTNPDIEIHEALTRAGSTHVAALHGYATVREGETELQLAMLQNFFRTASDGWELALASARNLFTDPDPFPDETGGDFAAEAHRLGVTLSEVHAVLAEAFGTSSVDAAGTAAGMIARLEQAVVVVPELSEHRDALLARFRSIEALGQIPVQRVHGDLHLGQTLRTSLDWKLVDFEGEPAKDLAVRRLPDSVWRDIAGMIRSFDYAASSVERDLAGSGNHDVVARRTGAWTAHNTMAFLAGYESVRTVATSGRDELLLSAYIADKAVYEAVYEARNRPGWLTIPLTAIAGLDRGRE